MNTSAQINPQNLERLRLLRYIDDDFSCTDPDDMNYEVLAKRARYFKQEKEGVAAMCKMMEEMRSEAAHDKVKEKAILMLKNKKISFDEIPIFFSELSHEEIEEIKSKVMQLV